MDNNINNENNNEIYNENNDVESTKKMHGVCDDITWTEAMEDYIYERAPLVKKNRKTAAILAFFLGFIGIHRFYLDKSDGILFIIFSFTYIPLVIGIIDGIRFLRMSDEKFDSLYNQKYFEALKNNSIDDSNKDNGFSADANDHEHIVPDKELSMKIKMAQDNLETRDSISNKDVRLSYVDRKNKKKELNELKKQGLISKEEYKEELKNL